MEKETSPCKRIQVVLIYLSIIPVCLIWFILNYARDEVQIERGKLTMVCLRHHTLHVEAFDGNTSVNSVT